MRKAMKKYPLEKYKTHVENNIVTAESTFAGQPVVANAKCDPRDDFSEEAGVKLAAARCNVKVATKRVNRAKKQGDELHKQMEELLAKIVKNAKYQADSELALDIAKAELKEIVEAM